MKQDVQVLIMVVCDQEPDKIPNAKEMSQIRKSLSAIEGVVETYVAPSTPEIVAFAAWDESEIPQKVAAIKKIDGVKKVETKILVSL